MDVPTKTAKTHKAHSDNFLSEAIHGPKIKHIGYADGLKRCLSNGVGKIYIKGKTAPVIGSVAMDMTMVDVTGIHGIREDDEVEIFGSHIPLEDVARACNTISYEILTGISQRVKRVYVEE